MTTSAPGVPQVERPASRSPSPAASEDAATALARIQAELASLHVAVLDLQAALGPTLAAAAVEASVAEAAQGLDLVAQSLNGLSTFVGALMVGAERSGRLDVAAAAARVNVGALSSRLAGRPYPTSGGPGRGDVELF